MRPPASDRTPIGLLVASAAIAAMACSRGAATVPPPQPPPRVAVAGIVVDSDRHLPLPGLDVVAGAERSTTDVDGRFTLRAVDPTYDLFVMSHDRAHLTIYRALRRRDPRVVFYGKAPTAPATRHATIVGELVGGTFPLGPDYAFVQFGSQRAGSEIVLGGRRAKERPGPAFGPLPVEWSGPDALEGDLVAVRSRADDAYQRAAQRVTIRDGETLHVELRMEPATRRKRVGVRVLGQAPGTELRLTETYRKAGTSLWFRGGSPSTEAYETPDLLPVGLALCTEAIEQQIGAAWSETKSCGATLDALDTPVALTLRPLPTITAPARGTIATPGMRFGWTALEGAVYRLSLRPWGNGESTPGRPTLDIVTSSPTDVWPDVPALGVAFPRPPDAYESVVEAFGPYSSADDAVGPEGIGTLALRTESFAGKSPTQAIPVTPPLGKEEAACVAPEAVSCATDAGREPEWYSLRAINNKIRHYPEFASAIGIHCVRDCVGARAFVTAYARYREQHANFDANEPIDEDFYEPPPPPPRP